VPAVFIASDYPFADNTFAGWDKILHSPRKWANGQVVGYSIAPEDVRAMLAEGFHPAETWVPAREDTLHFYLQARWYMENRGVLQRSADGSLRNLPLYVRSARPQLLALDGHPGGRKHGTYAVVYRHPEGLPPAQAEVWVDVNGDGRFNVDPKQGERFTMQPSGDDYRAGVAFTTSAPTDRPYVFRFADRNWNPPVRGGVIPGRTEGISYAHWSVRGEAVE
jgi:hypothetical protein